MQKYFASLILCLVSSIAIGAEEIIMPEWAYPMRAGGGGGGGGGGAREDPLVTVPGSTRQLRASQTSPFFGGIEDWFPERHGPMPDIVKYGR